MPQTLTAMANATLPPYPVFDTEDDISALPQKWEEWVDGLEDLMSALAINDHARKWSMMKYYGGDKLRKLEKQLQYDKTALVGADPAANPVVAGRTDHYANLKTAFTDHFAPCVNETYARFKFRGISQEEGESIDTFVTRLRSQSTRCRFHDSDVGYQIRDQIVFGCRSGKLRRKALAENLALDRLIQVARAEETARANAAEMEKTGDNQSESSADVFKVSKKPGKYSGRSAFPEPEPWGRRACDDVPNPPRPGRKCFNCGGPFPHSKDRPCPAKGKSCNKCSRLNHFASQCRGAKNVLAAVAQDGSSDDNFSASLGKVRHVDSVAAEPHFVTIDSDRGAIKFNPDTGADVTIIDALAFNALDSRPQLSKTGHAPLEARMGQKKLSSKTTHTRGYPTHWGCRYCVQEKDLMGKF